MNENPIDKQVGSTIRKLREERNLSREALGAALSVPVSGTAIEKYEAGINRVSASTLVEIAGALKIRLADLFDGVPQVMSLPDTRPGDLLQDNPTVQEAVANLINAIIIGLSNGWKSPVL